VSFLAGCLEIFTCILSNRITLQDFVLTRCRPGKEARFAQKNDIIKLIKGK
jgi:hypothetical protein